MIYIGLDVHKVNTTVAWLDSETGEISEAHNCPTDQLAEHLVALSGSKRIVMETGAISSFLARQLKSCGLEVMVVDAYKSHRLSEARQTAKTDKLDAQSLAWLLAAGLLEGAEVWVADEATAQLRELEHTRQRLTQQTTWLRNSLAAIAEQVKVLAAQHFSRVTATKNLSPRKWYYHLVYKHGPNVAKVALARRMLGIIFAMLRDGTEFDPTRLTGADAQS